MIRFTRILVFFIDLCCNFFLNVYVLFEVVFVDRLDVIVMWIVYVIISEK